MKKNYQKNKKTIFVVVFIVVISLVVGQVPVKTNIAEASVNLIKNGSFEQSINSDWSLWQGEDSERDYELFRSYEVGGIGLGSYSAGIEAGPGAPGQKWYAGLATEGSFNLNSGGDYYLTFFAKGSAPMSIAAFLINAGNSEAVTPVIEKNVSTEWAKYMIKYTPGASTAAKLNFMFGDMPSESVLYLDGIQLVEMNMTMTTRELKGFIGDRNKTLSIGNIASFEREDIEVELPYFNELTGEAERKRFFPETVTRTGIAINFYQQTFAGVGSVYVKDNLVGQFNYNVTPRVTELNPSMVRADEDLVIYGNGFNPLDHGTYVVLRVINTENKRFEEWIRPINMDSRLSLINVPMPIGVVSDSLTVRTSFMNMEGTEVANTSNRMAYKVKPVIHSAFWSERGYDQVGDKLRIQGKGISQTPSVLFYNEQGAVIDTKRARVISIGEGGEIIEVDTTNRINNFIITVKSGTEESDKAGAIEHSARPKLDSIRSAYSRTILSTSEKIQAAKVGDVITLNGQSFLPNENTSASVEFQGVNRRITVEVPNENISKNSRSLTVEVPVGVQSGYINVIINNQYSNSLPLEIIPTIEAIYPNPIIPEARITITAKGAGDNPHLARIIFNKGKADEMIAYPEEIEYDNWVSSIYFRTPSYNLASQSTTINLQYDKWIDDGNSVLNVTPYVSGASINMDTKILSIRGYGFSIRPSENVITYMYADENQTVINPNIRMLGVYATEEGQEIRIKINDNYHFGFVRVAVNGLSSHDQQFGPVYLNRIARRIEHVRNVDVVMGVLYISGYNFGPNGGVKVGEVWADVHYRSNFFIIAVVDQNNVYDNPIIVARE